MLQPFSIKHLSRVNEKFRVFFPLKEMLSYDYMASLTVNSVFFLGLTRGPSVSVLSALPGFPSPGEGVYNDFYLREAPDGLQTPPLLPHGSYLKLDVSTGQIPAGIHSPSSIDCVPCSEWPNGLLVRRGVGGRRWRRTWGREV